MNRAWAVHLVPVWTGDDVIKEDPRSGGFPSVDCPPSHLREQEGTYIFMTVVRFCLMGTKNIMCQQILNTSTSNTIEIFQPFSNCYIRTERRTDRTIEFRDSRKVLNAA